MQKIFLDRYSTVLAKFTDKKVYSQWGYSKAPQVSQILKDLGNRDQLLLRFSHISLSTLVKDPCSVRNQPDEVKDDFVQSFKRARAFLEISESDVCQKCDHKKTCKFFQMVPTQNPKLEFSDIFNILTAYADLSMSLEEERIALGISEIDLDEFLEDFDKKNSAERVAQSKQIATLRNHTQKYKHCFMVLNTLERLIEDNYDRQSAPHIEFCNTIDEHCNKIPAQSPQSAERGKDFFNKKFFGGSGNQQNGKKYRSLKEDGKSTTLRTSDSHSIPKITQSFNISTELDVKNTSFDHRNSNKFTSKKGTVLKSELSVLEEYQNPKDTSKPVQYDDSKKSFARKKPSERLVQTSSKSKMVLNKFHMREFKEKDTSENGLN